ncbi:MAG: M20/M25/M40 family metallo-hydrolase [Acinetobacter sp.]|jgi:aminopeptidase S|uniref:M20/M25/M40 family metallo-hydrolase n=1 Tax=Acinetobacter sp. TaxID=472 RepID=UPI0028232A91|nr:M20/M25/M40 family metallo-hydrolase [Acinetobacter sp.]MDR2060655.1 M20/M25/M40 family metallo-hydrolase [Acinetobacter sp.]
MFLKKILAVCVLSSMFAISGCQKNEQDSKEKIEEVRQSGFKMDTAQMMTHLHAFEQIAKQHGGNRAVGTQGGLASADYILDHAKKAGFTTELHAFENREKTKGRNIIVEIPGESKQDIILLGAHYDSVKMGPGINDNASGVALLLELMAQLSQQKIKPKHSIHLAFWDSEEVGIAGSQAYVKKLTAEQLKAIKAYINVDMVGTKDPEILIADGDKSSVDEMEKMLKERGMQEQDYKPLLDGLRSIPSHSGDLALENMLKEFFKAKNLKIKEGVATLTASDTAPFLGKVPVTSVILFNEQMKGDELEFAPCYHKACDTIEQVDPKSMQLAGDAVVYLLQSLDKK